MTDALGAAKVQQEHLILDQATSRQLSAPQTVEDPGSHALKACQQARLPDPACVIAAIRNHAPQDTAQQQVQPHSSCKARSCGCHIMPLAGWTALLWGAPPAFSTAEG